MIFNKFTIYKIIPVFIGASISVILSAPTLVRSKSEIWAAKSKLITSFKAAGFSVVEISDTHPYMKKGHSQLLEWNKRYLLIENQGNEVIAKMLIVDRRRFKAIDKAA